MSLNQEVPNNQEVPDKFRYIDGKFSLAEFGALIYAFLVFTSYYNYILFFSGFNIDVSTYLNFEDILIGNAIERISIVWIYLFILFGLSLITVATTLFKAKKEHTVHTAIYSLFSQIIFSLFTVYLTYLYIRYAIHFKFSNDIFTIHSTIVCLFNIILIVISISNIHCKFYNKPQPFMINDAQSVIISFFIIFQSLSLTYCYKITKVENTSSVKYTLHNIDNDKSIIIDGNKMKLIGRTKDYYFIQKFDKIEILKTECYKIETTN